MNNHEQPLDRDSDVVMPRPEDEPRWHWGRVDGEVEDQATSERPSDLETGPDDEDGLPDDAQRRVPS